VFPRQSGLRFLAQPPDTINETFLREVDENLRRDQLSDFVKRYARWLIAGVVLFLAASGGWIYWQQYQVQRSEKQVEELAQVYTDIGANKIAAAPQKLDTLSESGKKGVRASSLFARAALAVQQNDHKLAIAKYKEIASESGLPQAYRDAALIRQTALEFDNIKPEEVIARLAPLAKPGNPWFASAGEMTGMALIKQGKKQEAGRLFAAIAKDKTVPEGNRARSVQLASSLGVDAGTLPTATNP
jgi:hypothetical protein